MASTSMTSRRVTRGESFPEFVFPSSPGFISKENLAFDRKLTFTFPIKTSKSRDSQFKRRLFRFSRFREVGAHAACVLAMATHHREISQPGRSHRTSATGV